MFCAANMFYAACSINNAHGSQLEDVEDFEALYFKHFIYIHISQGLTTLNITNFGP